jgi:inward rectifier potassium channel
MARRSTRRNLGSNLSYSFSVIGETSTPWWDFYHSLLRMPWWQTLLIVVTGYLAINVVFAGLYLIIGGIGNARPGSLEDAFFFSIETLATIGYGSMYPSSRGANLLMSVESIIGLMVTAFATGLFFVRFSRIRGRILFSERVAIGPMDGQPTLMIRLGNARRNRIYDAEFRMVLSRTVRSTEGVVLYRSHDLKLVRDRAHTLAQSWMILHVIDASSPLYGETPESLARVDAELAVAVSGIDDTSLQPVHGRKTWEHFQIEWGSRLVDVLSEDARGNVELDLRRFHLLEPTLATPDFPYPRSGRSTPASHVRDVRPSA